MGILRRFNAKSRPREWARVIPPVAVAHALRGADGDNGVHLVLTTLFS